MNPSLRVTHLDDQAWGLAEEKHSSAENRQPKEVTLAANRENKISNVKSACMSGSLMRFKLKKGLLLSPLMQVKPVPLAGALLGECR